MYAHTPVEVEPPLHQPKKGERERRTTDRSSVPNAVGSPQGRRVGRVNIGLAHHHQQKEKGAEAVNGMVAHPTLLTIEV